MNTKTNNSQENETGLDKPKRFFGREEIPDSEVRRIYRMYLNEGRTKEEIAAITNHSTSTIYYFTKGLDRLVRAVGFTAGTAVKAVIQQALLHEIVGIDGDGGGDTYEDEDSGVDPDGLETEGGEIQLELELDGQEMGGLEQQPGQEKESEEKPWLQTTTITTTIKTVEETPSTIVTEEVVTTSRKTITMETKMR